MMRPPAPTPAPGRDAPLSRSGDVRLTNENGALTFDYQCIGDLESVDRAHSIALRLTQQNKRVVEVFRLGARDRATVPYDRSRVMRS